MPMVPRGLRFTTRFTLCMVKPFAYTGGLSFPKANICFASLPTEALEDFRPGLSIQ